MGLITANEEKICWHAATTVSSLPVAQHGGSSGSEWL